MPARPPGRAGRVWLAGRLDIAHRAAELLERKQELLRHQQRRLAELAERTGREWHVRVALADTWSTRALVLGGRDELRRAAATIGPAHARLGWRTEAGVTYPTTATVELPPPPTLAGAPTVAQAAAACRRALEAAVQHAAATTALRRADAELAATTRRLRAVRDRWLPRLQAQLYDLDLRLDETDREEIIRLRWAKQRSHMTPGKTRP